MKRFIATIFLFTLINASSSSFCQGNLKVTSPVDMQITETNRLYIIGSSAGAKRLYINGISADLENGGKFYAVAILKPGKNLIRVVAEYPDGAKLARKIRVLRVVNFDDVKKFYDSSEHWAKTEIVSLSTLGIIEGYPDNNFKPMDSVTRGEFATWTVRAKGLKVPAPRKDVYFDVPKEHWRAPYIKALVNEGYMQGSSKEEFNINSRIKRNEATAVVVKAFGIKPSKISLKSPFSDVTLSTDDANSIYAAYYNGLVIGVSKQSKLFEPERDMKRAEAALLISRIKAIKQMRTRLYDFGDGYDASKYCRIGTKPVIKYAKATPLTVIADGRSTLKLSVNVVDSQGRSDISQVWANLSAINGPNNAAMAESSAGIYELEMSLTSDLIPGRKEIIIKAMDKTGLETSAKINITVKRPK